MLRLLCFASLLAIMVVGGSSDSGRLCALEEDIRPPVGWAAPVEARASTDSAALNASGSATIVITMTGA